MRYQNVLLGLLFSIPLVHAGVPSPSPTSLSLPIPTPTDCGGPKCGGECGDGIRQPEEECDLGVAHNGAPNSGCTTDCKICPVCGDGKTEGNEECDAGDQNGVLGSGCSKDCKKVCLCGDGKVEGDEECDAGDKNGAPNSGCSKDCKKLPVCGDGVQEGDEECDKGKENGAYNSGCSTECTLCGYCGDGIKDDGEECDNGWHLNGIPGNSCSSNCTLVPDCTTYPVTPSPTPTPPPPPPPPATCATCNPISGLNLCTTSTSCIGTPSNHFYCACRAGYRADNLSPTDPKQFRLQFSGQEYRVFVAPGVECNTLCTTPFPGPDSCKEVPVQGSC